MARGLRSNRDNITTRQITAPATGPAPDTSSPTGTVPLAAITSADDLKAIEALAGTSGLLAKTAANAWALRQLALGTAFETIAGITNPAGVAGNPTCELDNQAANEVLAGPASGSPGAPGFRELVAADLPFEYEVGTFTPTFTFATPGTLSVAYTVQTGVYMRIGDAVIFSLRCAFTPTLGTASGAARFDGLPFASNATNNQIGGTVITSNSITWPLGTTDKSLAFIAGTTQMGINSEGTATAIAAWGTTQFPNATARNVFISGFYNL